MYKDAVEVVKASMEVTGRTQAQEAKLIGFSAVTLNRYLVHPEIYPDKANQDKLMRFYPEIDNRDMMLGKVEK